VKIARNVVDGPARGDRGFKRWISGLLAERRLAQWALVHLLNLVPTMCPGIITTALNTLTDNNYVDNSFDVMNIGAVDNVKTLALELYFEATDVEEDAAPLIKQNDKLLGVFADAA